MGVFITFEGIEGAGKSTQIRLLEPVLSRQGINTVLTREPGGTPEGESIRNLLLNTSNADFNPVCELFLFLSCRAQLVRERIMPALKAGNVVICDRYADATLAYQGYGRGLSHSLINDANMLASGGLVPDLTILLDLDPEFGLARIGDRGEDEKNRIDKEAVDFHRLVRNGYLEIKKENNKRIQVVDAAASQEMVAGDIARIVFDYLGLYEKPF